MVVSPKNIIVNNSEAFRVQNFAYSQNVTIKNSRVINSEKFTWLKYSKFNREKVNSENVTLLKRFELSREK